MRVALSCNSQIKLDADTPASPGGQFPTVAAVFLRHGMLSGGLGQMQRVEGSEVVEGNGHGKEQTSQPLQPVWSHARCRNNSRTALGFSYRYEVSRYYTPALALPQVTAERECTHNFVPVATHVEHRWR